MKVLNYLFVSCFTFCFTLLTTNSFGQSVDLFLSSDNNCQGQLEIGIYIQASQFSLFDFEIGSSSIFLDYDPEVVQYYSYIENEFSVNVGNPNGWLTHQSSHDDDCGMFNLVLELEDPAMNGIYLSRQQATKIGHLNFLINDPATDPKISVRPEFSSVFAAGSNDGTAALNILNIPRVLQYSCLDDCLDSPAVLSLEVFDQQCFDESGGSFEFHFEDIPNRDSLEISLNGGFNYNYATNDGSHFSITGLSSGYYDVWLRWKDDQCPTQIGNYYVDLEGGPPVDVSLRNNCDQSELGSIVFEFTFFNVLQFSIDGGNTFTQNISSPTGLYSIDGLDIGRYYCAARWGDESCMINLGIIDIVPADYPTMTVRQFGHCYSQQPLNGSLFFDIVDNPVQTHLLISVDGGITYPYQVNDDIGTFVINNFNQESFKIHAKWPSNQCSYNYGSGFFRYFPRDFDLALDHSQKACASILDGAINITLNTSENPKPSISIDGGQSFSYPISGQFQYQFDNLGPGDYPIYINWGDCIEFYSQVTIGETLDCPSCFDGIKNGDEVYIDCGGSSCFPCDECHSFVAVNANEIDENILFRSSDRIEIKGIIEENLDVELKAGQEILLKPQFEVSTSTVFKAYIEDCN